MRMVGFMCGVRLRDKCTNSDLRNRLEIDSIVEAVRWSRLRWFGYVERKADEDWVKRCTNMEVEGTRGRGRPKRTWMEVVQSDLRRLKIKREDAQNRSLLRRLISGRRQANLGDL